METRRRKKYQRKHPKKLIPYLTSKKIQQIKENIEEAGFEHLTTKDLTVVGVFTSTGQAQTLRSNGRGPRFKKGLSGRGVWYSAQGVMEWIDTLELLDDRLELIEEKDSSYKRQSPVPPAPPEEATSIRHLTFPIPLWVNNMMESLFNEEMGGIKMRNEWLEVIITRALVRKIEGVETAVALEEYFTA